MTTISLNTDIGEGFGAWRIADDEKLLSVVTDANAACGFHAGDPDILRATCETAAANGVGIGAQVGFHDIHGFGRRHIDVSRTSLANDVLYQIGALSAFAVAAGSRVSYVKAHGALYHSAVADPEYAGAVLDGMAAWHESLPLLCQPGTTFAKAAADAGVQTVAEGFIDRGYLPNGLLVPRSDPDALIDDVTRASERAIQFATEGTVTANDGSTVDMPVVSLCIHSDSPGAVELATAVRDGLTGAGIGLASFADR